MGGTAKQQAIPKRFVPPKKNQAFLSHPKSMNHTAGLWERERMLFFGILEDFPFVPALSIHFPLPPSPPPPPSPSSPPSPGLMYILSAPFLFSPGSFRRTPTPACLGNWATSALLSREGWWSHRRLNWGEAASAPCEPLSPASADCLQHLAGRLRPRKLPAQGGRRGSGGRPARGPGLRLAVDPGTPTRSPASSPRR